MNLIQLAKSASNKEAVRILRKFVGQAVREGADDEAIVRWLLEQGVQEPEKHVHAAKAFTTLPKLSQAEIDDVGGIDGFRALFGLGPSDAGVPRTSHLKLDGFVSLLTEHSYIHLISGDTYSPESLRVHLLPPKGFEDVCEYLDAKRYVNGRTWAPGLDQIIEDKLAVKDAGWLDLPGYRTLNLYLPPVVDPRGDPELAARWVEHIYKVYPDDADHIIKWMAWRVQHPERKINHALVFGGSTRIGKDTILVPLRHAVGTWNFKEVGPDGLMGEFNPHLQCVVLRVNEVRDQGEMNKFQLYEHCKWILANPPEFFAVNEKNVKVHPVVNVVGVVFTTNHKEGFYLPGDDARHYVCWSEARKEDFEDGYFKGLYEWYEDGGVAHVCAYLRQPHLLEGFDPAAPPPRTDAWRDIVRGNMSEEDSELMDLIEAIGSPEALVLQDLFDGAKGPAHRPIADWMADRKNRRVVGHRLRACGYVPIRNPDDRRDGVFKVNGKRCVVYAKEALDPRDRLRAARSKAQVPQEPPPLALEPPF